MAGYGDHTAMILYRWMHTYAHARTLYHDLRHQQWEVWMDAKNEGAAIEATLLGQVAARGHILLFLTLGSAERLASPTDTLRREIEYALDLQRNIIPIFIADLTWPQLDRFLTGKLAALTQLAPFRWSAQPLPQSLDLLRQQYLSQPLRAQVYGTAPDHQAYIQQKQRELDYASPPTENERHAELWLEQAYHRPPTDWDHKIADYTNAIAYHPQYAGVYYLRGRAHYEQRNLPAALQDLTYAIQLDPTADAYFFRGRVHAAQHNPQAEVADYNRALQLDPTSVRAYFHRAVARHALDDLTGAIADYGAALQMNPHYTKALYNRGTAKQALGDWQGALADYNLAVEQNPDYTDGLIARGLLYLDHQDYPNAVKDFEAALAKTRDAKLYLYRGRSYQDMGQPDRARLDFAMAIQLEPTAEAYFHRAKTYALNKREDKTADLTKAIELKPDYWEAYLERGKWAVTCAERDNHPYAPYTAIEDFSAVLQHQPHHAEALWLRARVYQAYAAWFRENARTEGGQWNAERWQQAIHYYQLVMADCQAFLRVATDPRQRATAESFVQEAYQAIHGGS